MINILLEFSIPLENTEINFVTLPNSLLIINQLMISVNVQNLV